ncbi:acetyl-CoA carboxylase biotin carboxyl carrier protein subunit, partial [Arthrobacter sp. GCM10027362]|uniref:acetyl-CoA carboxylase biotin carboxyl carrier protein subunit n=1 Tax=Arthrobacter sp. GCM10027362 TaxID=3273379 RepID=UPI0036397BCC
APAAQLVDLAAAGEHRQVRVTGTPGSARVQVDGGAQGHAAMTVRLHPGAVTVDGIRQPATWAVGEDGVLWLNYAGRTMAWHLSDREQRLRDALGQRPRDVGEASPEVRSPMPGTVTAVAVRSGDEVAAGQTLLSVEAMKMEHQLTAGLSGEVAVSVQPGDLVKAGQLVAVIRPAATTEEQTDA